MITNKMVPTICYINKIDIMSIQLIYMNILLKKFSLDDDIYYNYHLK